MKLLKNLGVFVVITLFLINIVMAVTVVQNTPTPPVEPKKSFTDFLKNPIFWYVLIGALLIIGLFIGAFFIVKWLVNYIKEQNDIFYKLKKERILLAKIHRRYPSKHWYKITQNIPIKLVRTENGKPYISNPIAYHRGDYATHEGNILISCNFQGRNKFWVFPSQDLIIIPNKEKIKIEQRNQETGKNNEITIDNLPLAKDIIQFNENEILIYAESISKSGYFFMPVIKAEDGKIIDLALPVFASLREVILHEYMYDQTSLFGSLAKKASDLNPYLRQVVKIQDNNSAVDIPKENQ